MFGWSILSMHKSSIDLVSNLLWNVEINGFRHFESNGWQNEYLWRIFGYFAFQNVWLWFPAILEMKIVEYFYLMLTFWYLNIHRIEYLQINNYILAVIDIYINVIDRAHTIVYPIYRYHVLANLYNPGIIQYPSQSKRL